MSSKEEVNINQQNETAWDFQAEQQYAWSLPVSDEVIHQAKKGFWDVHITKKALPESWLPHDIKSKKILCLASGGGQQAPVLAAAGAEVTVFDISFGQLSKDKKLSEKHQLNIQTVQGDMCDLSALSTGTFDYIIHPISNLYVPELAPVWSECYRVLKKNGLLLSSFYNPVVFVFSKETRQKGINGQLKPEYSLPYSDLKHLTQSELKHKMNQKEAIIFGHTLSSQISGQIEAGFYITGFYEDEHPSPRFLIEDYMDTMIATKAIKS